MSRYGSITARWLCIECTGAVYHITFREADGTSSPLVAGQPVELGGVVIPLTNPFPVIMMGMEEPITDFIVPAPGSGLLSLQGECRPGMRSILEGAHRIFL